MCDDTPCRKHTVYIKNNSPSDPSKLLNLGPGSWMLCVEWLDTEIYRGILWFGCFWCQAGRHAGRQFHVGWCQDQSRAALEAWSISIRGDIMTWQTAKLTSLDSLALMGEMVRVGGRACCTGLDYWAGVEIQPGTVYYEQQRLWCLEEVLFVYVYLFAGREYFIDDKGLKGSEWDRVLNTTWTWSHLGPCSNMQRIPTNPQSDTRINNNAAILLFHLIELRRHLGILYLGFYLYFSSMFISV